jgi:ribosomal protein L11 methylase PrmA
MHVIVNSLAGDGGAGSRPGKRPALSRAGLELLLRSLRRAIEKLQPPRKSGSWGGYEVQNSYSVEERRVKHEAVREFIRRRTPEVVLDIGCNAGEYAELALSAGASQVIGLERDEDALQEAVTRAGKLDKPFLPLQVDIQNPTPDLGWDLEERRSLKERVVPDALLCLALIHHLVLGEGIPLSRAIRGITSLAPRGVIEFVPKEDPMSQRIAGPPSRLTHPYDEATFTAALEEHAHIEARIPLTATGRILFEFRRR